MGLQVDFDTTAREPNGKKETQGGSSKTSHTSNQIIAYYCGDVYENSSNDHSETGSTGSTDPTISSHRHDASRGRSLEGFVGIMIAWPVYPIQWSTLTGHGIALIEPRDQIRFPTSDLEAPASSLLLQLLELHFLSLIHI